MECVKQLLALFREYDTDTLNYVDYAVIDDYEKAIRLLENAGKIRVCHDVVQSIELL